MSDDVAKQEYRELSDAEKKGVKLVKAAANAYIQALNNHVPAGREQALAITNAQQSVFWATNGITK